MGDQGTRQPMPTRIKVALAILTFQMIVNAANGVLVLVVNAGRLERRQEVSTYDAAVPWINFTVAIAVLVCLVLISKRAPLGGIIGLLVECVAILTAILGAVFLGPAMLVGVVVPAVAIGALMGETEWFKRY